jgi:hypothetical protein
MMHGLEPCPSVDGRWYWESRALESHPPWLLPNTYKPEGQSAQSWDPGRRIIDMHPIGRGGRDKQSSNDALEKDSV